MAKIRSMTGMGTARGKIGTRTYNIEVRSLNNRYLDVSVRLPYGWTGWEGKIKQAVQGFCKRGKVSISVAVNGSDEETSSINEPRLKKYYRDLNHIAKGLKASPVELKDLVRLPQVFGSGREEITAEKGWSSLNQILTKALETHAKSREKEGEGIHKDFTARLTTLKKLHQSIESGVQKNIKEIQEKLALRIQELAGSPQVEDERWQKEAAYLAEKSDISEELSRFRSHLDLFQSILKSGKEIGKKLDFTLQELNREANTIASKAGVFQISKSVIEMKSEIEKIREQVQNVE